MSDVIYLHVDFADHESALAGAALLRDKLASLPQVGEADAEVDDYLIDTEQVLVGVTAAVQLIQLADDGSGSLRNLIGNVRELAREIRGVRRIRREVDGELRYLDDHPFDDSDDES
ncbi:hypothetical protein [Streptomyces sp. NPDC047000]|uniref:hypothetical protein n=1 Tax=Streptomyces sp. NPDC047000 TaxID=3155474 RepID=UPI003404BF3A